MRKNHCIKPQKYIVIPDLHVPEHNPKSLAAVNQYIFEHAPWNGLIYLGDVLDFCCISSHNEKNLRAVEGQRLLHDYKIADEEILKAHLKLIRAKNPAARVIWLQGNHEERIERYINANPPMQGLIEPENVLRLRERRIEWIPFWSEGKVLTIGKCTFLHGRFCSEHHAKAHAIRYGTNSDCFYGHVHDLQCYSNYGGHISQCLGCMCLSPKWLQGRITRWIQCFAEFQFLPDGHYRYTIIRL
jgi:hypothetical protein